jgi:hypothetical protein
LLSTSDSLFLVAMKLGVERAAVDGNPSQAWFTANLRGAIDP